MEGECNPPTLDLGADLKVKNLASVGPGPTAGRSPFAKTAAKTEQPGQVIAITQPRDRGSPITGLAIGRGQASLQLVASTGAMLSWLLPAQFCNSIAIEVGQFTLAQPE